jgi:ethanolamine utilization protein EutQ
MSDPPLPVRKVQMFPLAAVSPPSPGTRSTVAQYIDAANGSIFAGGLVIFDNCNFDWTVWYDELLFCHRVEGSFSVAVAAQRYDLGAGDSLWLPAGTELRYQCDGRSWLFFCVAPANWRELRPKNDKP